MSRAGRGHKESSDFESTFDADHPVTARAIRKAQNETHWEDVMRPKHLLFPGLTGLGLAAVVSVPLSLMPLGAWAETAEEKSVGHAAFR